MSLEISVAVTGVVVSLLAGAVASAWKAAIDRRSEKHRLQYSKDAKRRITEIGLNIAGIQLSHRIDHAPEQVPIQLTDELFAQIEEGIISRIAEQRELSGTNVQAEVDKAVTEFKGRLESIEARFPDNSSIDKIASINDALFAERIEQLSSRLNLLEQKQLTKWDIAITVSMVVAGICTVVGATYGVLKTLGFLAQ